MFGVGSAISLSLGAYLYFGDWVTLGTVYLIFHYTQMLVMPINRFTQQLDNFQRATAAIARIVELDSVQKTIIEPPVQDRVAVPDDVSLSVRFDDVTFAYNDEPVLHDVSLDLKPGRVLGLLGRTGSGQDHHDPPSFPPLRPHLRRRSSRRRGHSPDAYRSTAPAHLHGHAGRPPLPRHGARKTSHSSTTPSATSSSST